MKDIVLIAHNLRSAHNVGSLLRTADGTGLSKVYFTGYTPYPVSKNDPRLPHLATKINRQIHKTALGAEESMAWEHYQKVEKLIDSLKEKGYLIAAIEQARGSVKLTDFKSKGKLALIVGREVEGLEPEILKQTDVIVEIPMLGAKESFNVAIAGAIVMYHCQYVAKP